MRHEPRTQWTQYSSGLQAGRQPSPQEFPMLGRNGVWGFTLESSSPRATGSPCQAGDAAIFNPGQPAIGHRFGARWEPPVRHLPATRGPRVSIPSLGLQCLPVLSSRAASPDRAPFLGCALGPLPVASVSPAPSTSGPSVRSLVARRVQPPPSRFDGPSLSARPPPTGLPRPRSTSLTCQVLGLPSQSPHWSPRP